MRLLDIAEPYPKIPKREERREMEAKQNKAAGLFFIEGVRGFFSWVSLVAEGFIAAVIFSFRVIATTITKTAPEKFKEITEIGGWQRQEKEKKIALIGGILILLLLIAFLVYVAYTLSGVEISISASAHSFTIPKVKAGAQLREILTPAPQPQIKGGTATKFPCVAVVIDPGHGPNERNVGWNGILEADLTWGIAESLRLQLEDAELQVVMTRDASSTPNISERRQTTKDSAGVLMISIHTNAPGAGSDVSSIRGFAAYYAEGWEEDRVFAQRVAEAYAEVTGLPTFSGGPVLPDSASNPGMLGALYGGVPSALIECGFHTHPEDAKFLSEYPEIAAQGIAQGIFAQLEAMGFGSYDGCEEILRQAATNETHQETQIEVSSQSVVGLWVDAFNTPLQTKHDVDSLVDFANEKGVNLLVAEVRKRGVVYYSGSPEPAAVAGFDPLAYLLEKADTAGIGTVHAWLDAGWRNQSTHLDFTNPIDREYLKSLVRPLLNYESLEGIHLDWIRYDESVEITDGHREDLTSLVSEIFDMCRQKGKKLSVATITWDPSPQRVGGFAGTRPYLGVGQDWESWVEDGIIDILMPMNYFSDQLYKEWLEYETNLCSNANVELVVGIPDYMDVDTDEYRRHAFEAGADGIIYYSYDSLRSKESVQGIATGSQDSGVAGTSCGDGCIWSRQCAERAGIQGTVCVQKGSNCDSCEGG